MKDYFQEATDYVVKQIGHEYAVDRRNIVDDEHCFGFIYHTKAFLDTGDFSKITAGQRYTFIIKRDNRIVSFGSGLSFEQARTTLEKSLAREVRIKKHKPEFDPKKGYDIRITHINKRWVIIDKLLKSEATYTIPEIVGDSIFRIPQKYNSKLLEERLTRLPVTFCGIKDRLSLIDELLAADACRFELVERQEKSFAKYRDKATEEDLKSIW
jgi:hypothetical protein